MMNDYTPIIGLEIHVELKTKSKMFCGCKNDPFHADKPNIYTCPVCLGMPGGLPVPNQKAIEWTIMLGQALGCTINTHVKFDRKNYFYPDLAKGYQISQYDQPIATNGKLVIPITNNDKRITMNTIRIRRVHIEEDTGKLQHATVNGNKVTLIDFNRSGVPLVEIVTEPDIRSGQEAKAFLKNLHQIIRYLDISDADMEKGSMRLEPNISVKVESKQQKAYLAGRQAKSSAQNYIGEQELPAYKVEVKNINSFNFVKKAIEFEVPRHIAILEKGELPRQETRGWNEDKGETFPQRQKEEAHDYRYFPDPDIPPLHFTQVQIDAIRKSLPELPGDKLARFVQRYALAHHTAAVLVELPVTAQYFEEAVQKGREKGIDPKTIANWMVNKNIDTATSLPSVLIDQISAATTIVPVSDEEIIQAIERVLADNPKAVADYKTGKQTVLMFLFGQTMKSLGGRGDKENIQNLLKKRL